MIDYKDWSSTSSSDKMLTSSSGTQYLHPDYLQPLPATLDAKKSPLALLAQTCSSIGKDSSSSKSLIPPIDKKDSSKQDKDSSCTKSQAETPARKSTSPSADERIKSPECAPDDRKEDGAATPDSDDKLVSSPRGFRTLRESAPCSTSSFSKSPAASSPQFTSRNSGDSSTTSTVTLHASPASSSAHNSTKSCAPSTHSLLDINHDTGRKTDLRTSPFPANFKADALSASTLGNSAVSGFPGTHLPLFGTPHLPMDSSHLSAMYPGLAAAHASLAKQSAGIAHSPFMSYTRVKTATGASTLVPVCKDPYCSHCQVSMQSAQLHGSLPCPAGCAQCQDKSHLHTPTSLASAAAYSAALGGLSLLPSSLSSASHNSSALASLYSHGMAASMVPGSQAGLPFVCNWMSGGDYCGKRFTSSEELLQHLRSHTSSTSSADAALAAYTGLGLSAYHSHLAAAVAAGASTPGDTSAVLRQSSYPRSLSPSSLFAASRYHPYKANLSALSVPTPSGLPVGLQPPQLPFSPYGLYSSRLGSAVTP